jgi:hypothetical protein
MEGKVTSSTGITGMPKFFIKSSVPPVEYKQHFEM